MRLHEDNIKADLYLELKKLNIPCILEYSFDNCRFDIALFTNTKYNQLMGIIEIKRSATKPHVKARCNRLLTKANQNNFILTKQLKKYIDFDVPVFVVAGTWNISNGVNFARMIFEHHTKTRYTERYTK